MGKSLKILSINHPGALNNEYVCFRALDDVELGEYVLMGARFRPFTEPMDEQHRVFAFPRKAVAKGQFVSLRTREGTDEVFGANTKAVVHVIYMNRKESLWCEGGDTAHLVHVTDATVQSKNVCVQGDYV